MALGTKNDDGAIHNRFFYKINVLDAPDGWDYQPTGRGGRTNISFVFGFHQRMKLNLYEVTEITYTKSLFNIFFTIGSLVEQRNMNK